MSLFGQFISGLIEPTILTKNNLALLVGQITVFCGFGQIPFCRK
jgi:hypothetical protein